MLGERGDLVTTRCATAIRKLAHNPEACVPALRKAMGSGQLDPGVGLPALGAFGAAAADAVPDIRGYLDGENLEDALLALGNIGPDAADAVPAIIRIMEDARGDEMVRRVAAGTLVSIGAPAVPALAEHVHTSQSVRAMDAIGTMGRTAKAAIPSLVEVLETKERFPGVSWNEAAWALKRVGLDRASDAAAIGALERAAARGVPRAKEALAAAQQ